MPGQPSQEVVQTFPMFAPTRRFPNAAMANIPPGALSYFSHWLATQVFWHGGNSGTPRFSKQFPQDFPSKLYWPFKQAGDRPVTPLVFAYSPTVLPRPVDWTAPDISVPGYFFLDMPGYAPTTALAEFLAKGVPPVCVSFGSMVHRDAQRIAGAVLDALKQTRQRGIILTGWGGWSPDPLPEDIFAIDAVPHDWLFPRCKVIIHHGGAGTTGAGLRAGVPNIVVPFAGDQPFWGRRVAALNAGPEPIPVKKLDAGVLAAALTRALDNESIRQSAAEVGEKIRREDGVGETIRLVETWAETFHSRKG